jgi:hypothetical protein
MIRVLRLPEVLARRDVQCLGAFIYCSRCRRMTHVAQAARCERTGAWRCLDCQDRKVSA